ncbi:MAG: secretin N-terminal domain-containing protein [Candidatus Competibacteraceae bacterium]
MPCATPLAWADRLEIIELRHRNAEDMIPILRPLMQGQGVVTGRGSQLILRTTPQQLEQIQALINELDTPQRRLLISVRQSGQTEREHSAGEWAGAVDSGNNGRLEIGRGVPGEGVRLGIDSGNRRRNERINQQVQVLDGGEAFIEVGAEKPRRKVTAFTTGRVDANTPHFITNR